MLERRRQWMEESPQRCTATCRLGAATRNFSPALANMHLDHAPDRPASKQLPGSSYTQPSVAIPSPSIIRLDTPYPPPPPIPTPSPSLSIVHHRRRYQLTTSHFPCALPAAGFPPAVNAATLRASHRQPRRPGENIYGYVNHLLFRYDPPATRYRYPLPPQFPNLPASPPHWTSPPPQLRHLGHSRVKCPSTVTQPFRLHRGLLHTSSRCLVVNTILDASSRVFTAVGPTSTRPTTHPHPDAYISRYDNVHSA